VITPPAEWLGPPAFILTNGDAADVLVRCQAGVLTNWNINYLPKR